MFNNDLMKACLAAVFAMGLAACGSSSSDTAAPAEPEPTPEEMAEMACTSAGGQWADGMCTTAEELAEMACTDGGGQWNADMTCTTADELALAALRQEISDLRTQLGITDAEDVGNTVADLQAEVTRLQGELQDKEDAEDTAATMAMTATGKAVFSVLDTFGGTFTADTTRPTAEVAPVATPPGVVAKSGGATTLTPTALNTFVNGLSAFGADTAYTAAQAGMPETLAANNGFSGTMLTWSNTGKADTMTVYTDIAAPGSRLFAEVHGNNGTPELDPADTAHLGVTGSAFDGRTGGQVAHTPNAKLTTASTENDLVRLSGAYQGAVGNYTCTPGTGTCATSVSEAGITFVDTGATTGWMFTANNGAMVSVADSAYMTLGWWMRDDKNSADILDHVAVFYSAPHADALDVTALTGTATYEGGAAGKYSWRDRVADTAHGGHFTAKASLTADFGAADATGTVNGTISDFRTGDDGTMQNWTVTLSAAALDSGGAVARGTDNVTWAVGSSEADAAGSWEAQVSNSGTPRNDDLPTGIAGAFNSEFNEQGRMIGAFGANITNANPPK